jgi:hypothetical protein
VHVGSERSAARGIFQTSHAPSGQEELPSHSWPMRPVLCPKNQECCQANLPARRSRSRIVTTSVRCPWLLIVTYEARILSPLGEPDRQRSSGSRGPRAPWQQGG